MDWHDTPIFVISYNRLDLGLRRLIGWLKSAGMSRITVIDNASTWPPLLQYYETLTDVQMLMLPENHGHDVFWKLGYHQHQNERFIVTDPDVVPDANCPLDLVYRMHQMADRYFPAKVGPGLRIDNLPEHYHLKQLMLDSETKYWDNEHRTNEGHSFFAQIDTTFALYEPGADKWGNRHIRLDFPYVVEHVPWYLDSSQPHAERDYYKATALPGISHS